MSRPLPCGTPSTTSTSTTSPSSLYARFTAQLAPTLPPPTTVILLRISYRLYHSIQRVPHIGFEKRGAICAARAGLRASRVSQQDRACSEWRRGRSAAPRTHSRVLRMFRLALGGAWSLAAGALGSTL